MAYTLFLFDLDDTLLDFKASERLAFAAAMQDAGVTEGADAIYADYKVENERLWTLFERGKVSKDHLRVERFRAVFEKHEVEIDPASVSERYIEALPQTVVLMEHADALCAALSAQGEIGIITNGMEAVQMRRIRNSAIAPYISFVGVSEACGFAKPHVKFFEYCAHMAKRFHKDSTIIVGDRLEADIRGAQNFGIDSCWFNPQAKQCEEGVRPTYEVQRLSEVLPLLAR